MWTICHNNRAAQTGHTRALSGNLFRDPGTWLLLLQLSLGLTLLEKLLVAHLVQNIHRLLRTFKVNFRF